jgi:hypothetical protein
VAYFCCYHPAAEIYDQFADGKDRCELGVMADTVVKFGDRGLSTRIPETLGLDTALRYPHTGMTCKAARMSQRCAEPGPFLETHVVHPGCRNRANAIEESPHNLHSAISEKRAQLRPEWFRSAYKVLSDGPFLTNIRVETWTCTHVTQQRWSSAFFW